MFFWLPSRRMGVKNKMHLAWEWHVLRYPRGDTSETNSDLCTLRIDPSAEHGWMVAENRERSEALVYAWERAAFPWLMVRTNRSTHTRMQYVY